MFVLIFALAGHTWKNSFSVTEDQINLAKSPETKKFGKSSLLSKYSAEWLAPN